MITLRRFCLKHLKTYMTSVFFDRRLPQQLTKRPGQAAARYGVDIAEGTAKIIIKAPDQIKTNGQRHEEVDQFKHTQATRLHKNISALSKDHDRSRHTLSHFGETKRHEFLCKYYTNEW